ncbi:hypothetical protein Tsubulata_002461 [Turnera subulata]|uniref:Uncharacterized protein n=1 Tax=Turnera subulata TaxID=218843 RepID=A0A9Q0J2G1_9ROSI|nr:hypothetical protein Tsubulata_002461 [Turnera subulata]
MMKVHVMPKSTNGRPLTQIQQPTENYPISQLKLHITQLVSQTHSLPFIHCPKNMNVLSIPRQVEHGIYNHLII